MAQNAVKVVEDAASFYIGIPSISILMLLVVRPNYRGTREETVAQNAVTVVEDAAGFCCCPALMLKPQELDLNFPDVLPWQKPVCANLSTPQNT